MTNAIANMHCPAPFEAMRPPGSSTGDGAQGENGEGNAFLQTLASLAGMQWITQGQISTPSSLLGICLDLPTAGGPDEPAEEDGVATTSTTPDTAATLMPLLPVLGTVNTGLPLEASTAADLDILAATSQVDNVGNSRQAPITGLTAQPLTNPEMPVPEVTMDAPTINSLGSINLEGSSVPASLTVPPSLDPTRTAGTATPPDEKSSLQSTSSESEPFALQATAAQSRSQIGAQHGNYERTASSAVHPATPRDVMITDALPGQGNQQGIRQGTQQVISSGSAVVNPSQQMPIDPTIAKDHAAWPSVQVSDTVHQTQPPVFAATSSDKQSGDHDSFSSNQGNDSQQIPTSLDLVTASKISAFDTVMKTASNQQDTSTFAKPTSFDSREVLSQVVKQAQLLTFPTHSEVHMQLQPPSLGQIHLLMRSENNTISIHIRAESNEISQFLQQTLPQLQTALSDQGLQVDKLLVSLNQGLLSQDGGQGRRPTSPDENRKTPRSGADPVTEVDPLETSASLSPAYYSGRASYTINYLV